MQQVQLMKNVTGYVMPGTLTLILGKLVSYGTYHNSLIMDRLLFSACKKSVPIHSVQMKGISSVEVM